MLLEAERNIQGKLGAEALERYHRLLVLTPLALLPLPPHGELVRCAGLVGEKDAQVLAAALAARAPFLVTLDRLLAERINQAELGILGLAPGDFITTELPDHPDYPKVRS